MRVLRPGRFARALAVVAVVAAVAVPAVLAFGFNDGNHPPDGVVGSGYSYQFSVDGGCKPYDFVALNGALPPGLAFDASTRGLLTGTPTTAGSYFFWLEVRDTGCSGGTCPPAGVSCTIPSQRPFTINIAPKLTVSTDSLAPALVGVPYTVKLVAAGGGSQVWSVLSGALPSGLSLATDGTLSGTPAAATPDPATFVVKVTDDARTDTKPFVLDVVTPLAATPATLPVAEVGHALTSTPLAATGGRAPYTWALTGAPGGIAIDPGTGTISGKPTTAGSFPFQATVTDKYGSSAHLGLSVSVRAKLQAATLKLPVFKAGKLLKITLRSAGGAGPVSWKVTSGKFPPGVRFDRKTGVLTGTPRRGGLYRLGFTATDTLGVTSQTRFTLTVSAVPKKK